MNISRNINVALELVNSNIKLLPLKLGVGLVLPTFFMLAVYLPSVAAFHGVINSFRSIGGIESILTDPSGALWSLGSSALLSSLLLWVGLLICFYCYMISQAGVAGIIGRVLREPDFKITLGEFIRQGRGLLKPFTRYIMLFLFILVLFILTFALGAAVIAGISESLPDGTAAKILSTMMELTAGLVFIISLAALCAVGVQGIAILVFDGKGAWRALLSSMSYLWRYPARADMIAFMFIAYAMMQVVMGIAVGGAGAADSELGYFLGLLAGACWLVLNVYMTIIIVAVVMVSYHQEKVTTLDDSTHGSRTFPAQGAGLLHSPAPMDDPAQG